MLKKLKNSKPYQTGSKNSVQIQLEPDMIRVQNCSILTWAGFEL